MNMMRWRIFIVMNLGNGLDEINVRSAKVKACNLILEVLVFTRWG